MSLDEKGSKIGAFRRTFYLKKNMQTTENEKAIKWLESLEDFSTSVFEIIRKYIEGELLDKKDVVNMVEYNDKINELKKIIEEKDAEIIKKEQLIGDIELRKNKLEDSLNLQINMFNKMLLNGSIESNLRNVDKKVYDNGIDTNINSQKGEIAITSTNNNDKQEILEVETDTESIKEVVSIENDKSEAQKNQEVISIEDDKSKEKKLESPRMRRNVSSIYKNQV